MNYVKTLKMCDFQYLCNKIELISQFRFLQTFGSIPIWLQLGSELLWTTASLTLSAF